MKATIEIFDILHGTRAMRRLKTDPVPEALIDEVLRAAVAAPSGGNRQPWRFLVVRDPQTKTQVQKYYKRALDEVVGPHYATSEPPPGVNPAQYERQHAAVEYLTDHFHLAPVWIVACLDSGGAKPNRASGASIYPAVQNMLLACRALGLGATLTTRHLLYAREVDEILGLPEGIDSYAIVPIGYPMGRFGPVRRSLDGIVFNETWGNDRYGAT